MLTRIITRVICIIAAVGIITKGGMLFNAAVTVLAAVAWYEYHKPAEILGKVILWPVALMEAVVRYSSTHHNIKPAL